MLKAKGLTFPSCKRPHRIARFAQASWIADAAAVGTATAYHGQRCSVMHTYHAEVLYRLLPLLRCRTDETSMVEEGDDVEVRRRHLDNELVPLKLNLGKASSSQS